LAIVFISMDKGLLFRGQRQCSLQLIVPALNASLQREWFFNSRLEPAPLEVRTLPREVGGEFVSLHSG
jgi:hypothetical protein